MLQELPVSLTLTWDSAAGQSDIQFSVYVDPVYAALIERINQVS